ncbi:MAG: ABC transporter ATP-binding protein [Planctomycetota bacterium]|jgi:putative ABC transport system ATP-binding protein
MTEPILKAESVTKIYRRGEFDIVPLEEMDLDIEEGGFVSLMGPSGSGKTTLLNLVAGIDRPTAGRLMVAGADLNAMSDGRLASWRTRTVGYIFQLYNLIPVLTAYENVELPLLLLRLSRKDRKHHVETALAAVGLSDRADHFPRQLSGGQEQRVAIARAIVSDPKILLADEPTGDLDAKSAGEIMDLLVALRKEFGKTMIMVTHDPSVAGRADVVYYLNKGKLSVSENGKDAAEVEAAKDSDA